MSTILRCKPLLWTMSFFRLTRRLLTLQPAASAGALRLKHRPLLCSTLSTRTSCVASCPTKTCQKKSSPNLSLYRATPRGSNTSWPPGMVAKPSVVLFSIRGWRNLLHGRVIIVAIMAWWGEKEEGGWFWPSWAGPVCWYQHFWPVHKRDFFNLLLSQHFE